VIDQKQFVDEVLRMAREHGFTIQANKRSGEAQIDFGDKRLRAGHIAALHPALLAPNADFAALIEKVAPGRQCSHQPMREIIEHLRVQGRL
jgi:hypothetical protein